MAAIQSVCPLCSQPAMDYGSHQEHSFACNNPACAPSEMTSSARRQILMRDPRVRASLTERARMARAAGRILMIMYATPRPEYAGETFEFRDRPWPYD